MPYINERAEDSPVTISTFSGVITPEDFRAWDEDLVNLVMTHLHAPFEKLYVIMDMRQAHMEFTTLISEMRQTGNMDTSAGDGEVDVMLVGTDAMSKLASEMARLPQFGGFNLPLFRNVEDALAYVAVDQQKLKQRN